MITTHSVSYQVAPTFQAHSSLSGDRIGSQRDGTVLANQSGGQQQVLQAE